MDENKQKEAGVGQLKNYVRTHKTQGDTSLYSLGSVCLEYNLPNDEIYCYSVEAMLLTESTTVEL